MLKKISLFLSVVIIAACSKSTDNNEKIIDDLLVKNNEITGWIFNGSGWTANTISSLTGYIDGEADIYQRYGFVEAAFQEYSGNVNDKPVNLGIYIYNQGTGANALSVYNDPGLELIGAIDWNGGAGEKSHYERSNGMSQRLTFVRDKYFVKIDIMTDTEESLNIIKQFALNVDSKIKK